MQQRQKVFFNIGGMDYLPPPPTEDSIRKYLASEDCPLNEVIVSKDNEGSMRNLKRFAFSALKNFNRSCRGCNFGIYCPPGQGKTFIVKKFAETIGIPFIFVQSPSLDSTYGLFKQISDEFEKFGTPIVPVEDNKDHDFLIPPCIIFFDEAHELKSSMMKGSLLNAMEPDDGYMHVRFPGTEGKVVKVDCYQICWVAATTDRGDLFDAFESRLTTAIEWKPSTELELVQIVKAGLSKKVSRGELSIVPPDDICAIISKYQKVPRLAIHGFGTKVVQQKEYNPSCSWEECCKIVAHDMGLNDFGLNEKQMAILTALGQRPIAEPRLATVAKCRIAQVRKYELPALMQYGDSGPMVISVSGKGMCITEKGIALLDKLKISHNGHKVTAEHVESKR